MYRYAQINLETGHCMCVSYLAGDIEADYMIPLEDDQDVQPGDIYADGEWTRLEPEPMPESGLTEAERITVLVAENDLLKAQNQALSDRAEFIEDIIAEMAMKIYQ